jgi:hypothetical protein
VSVRCRVLAQRVISLRCNDSSAIGDQADPGRQSDRRIYKFTAQSLSVSIESKRGSLI